MSRITGRSTVAPLAIFKQATSVSTGTGTVDQSFDTYVGQRFDTSDGRELVLVQNGAVALTQGVLVQSAAEVTGHENLAITVPAAYPATAGSTQIYATNGSTVVKQNYYAGGYLVVSAGTGIGQTLKISSNAPAAANASFVITLEDPIQVTLDATSTVSLSQNMYTNVIINPASASGAPVGVTIYALAASTAPTWDGTSGAMTAVGVQQYGLVHAKGQVGCLVDNTVTNVGYPLGRSAATAGAVGVASLTTAAHVGTSIQTLTSAKVGQIFLNL
jgi:hypothetical protein